ncbi:MAG: hypothetical protein DMF88_05155 [Acidobacteria bacterium]|nr:MAG: hypothetical protein DMF88_05155 [Acidobacteriota bacterium]
MLVIVSVTLSVAAADLLMDTVEHRRQAPFYTNLTPAELAKLPVVTSGTITGAYVDEITDLDFHEAGTPWLWAGQRQGSIEFLVKGRWNNIGCHDDRDYPYSSRPAVLFVGDSFIETMQLDVRDTFYDRLRHDRFGERFDVWACGAAGFHASRAARYFDNDPKATEVPAFRRLASLRPTYVMYVVYMGNDLRDEAGSWFEDAEGHGAPCAPRLEPGQSFLWFRLRQVADMYLTPGGADVRCLNNSFWPYVKTRIPAVEEGWRSMFEGLDRLNRTVTRRGGTLLVGMIEPFPVPYGSFAMARAIRANYPGGKALPLDLALPHTRLAAFAASRGIAFVDFSEALRGCGGRDHYYPSDSHFNAVGHRCVAAYIDAHQDTLFP